MSIISISSRSTLLNVDGSSSLVPSYEQRQIRHMWYKPYERFFLPRPARGSASFPSRVYRVPAAGEYSAFYGSPASSCDILVGLHCMVNTSVVVNRDITKKRGSQYHTGRCPTVRKVGFIEPGPPRIAAAALMKNKLTNDWSSTGFITI